MARDPYIEQRLITWGRWKAGRSGGGLGYASTPWSEFDGGDRYSTRAAIVPDGEEAITDQAVASLPDDQQRALWEQFVADGSDIAKAQRVGCHWRTFRSRVNAAMIGVSRWITERQRGQDRQREDIENQQRARSDTLARRVSEAAAERRRTDKILGVKMRRVRKSG